MREDTVAQLSRQIANAYASEPSRRVTLEEIERTVARVRKAFDRYADTPPPFPGIEVTEALSDEEASAIVAGVLARLARRDSSH